MQANSIIRNPTNEWKKIHCQCHLWQILMTIGNVTCDRYWWELESSLVTDIDDNWNCHLWQILMTIGSHPV